MNRKQLFYILILYKDLTYDLFFTYAVDHMSALDLFYDSHSVDSSLTEYIICSTPDFL